jgi:hypothetical protein
MNCLPLPLSLNYAEPQEEDDDDGRGGGEFYHEDLQREEDRKRWERNAQQELVDGAHAYKAQLILLCLTFGLIRNPQMKLRM